MSMIQMNFRKVILAKLKQQNLEISVNLLDKYYYFWKEETNYPYSKFDGFLDFVELDEVFDDFCKKLKTYIKDGL
jgi:hypothetical protein